MEIAQEILRQLGGQRFIAMTGSKNFVGKKDGLTFKVGQNAKGVTHVTVTLDPNDTYTVAFFKIRGTSVKRIVGVANVYNDNLQAVFTENTGLYTRL